MSGDAGADESPDDAEDDAFPRGPPADEPSVGGVDVAERPGADVDRRDPGERPQAEEGEDAEPEGVLRATVGESLEVLVRRRRWGPRRTRWIGLSGTHRSPVQLAL